MVLGPIGRELAVPLSRHHLEAVRSAFSPGRFGRLPVFAWVDAIGQQFAGSVAPGSGFFQSDIGIDAKG